MKQILLTVTGCLILIGCSKKSNKKDEIVRNSQEDVMDKESIDSVLGSLRTVKYNELDTMYLNYSHPNNKFNSELKNREYYKVNGLEIKKKVVGHFTIEDFLARDDYYKEYLKNPYPEFEQYWLIDKGVLYMMLELITGLEEGGYNREGFHIRNSHRHPKLNTDANGASYSQHMFGKAIDIGVEDIDKDGDWDQDDKSVVYEMLQGIVGNKGGLGLYPGTMSLHFDCRGFRARWDWP